jgi:hypothetical protein
MKAMITRVLKAHLQQTFSEKNLAARKFHKSLSVS